MMEFIKKLVQLTHASSLLLTLASCFVIYSFAHFAPNFSYTVFAILVFAFCCVHLANNLYDDYRVIKKQLQEGRQINEVSFSGFVPRGELIRNKSFSVACVRRIVNFLFVIAFSIGLCFTYSIGWPVLIFMLIGAVLSLMHPVLLKYGISEIITSFIFGPLMIMGGYYAITGGFEMRLFAISIAVMFIDLAVIHACNIMNWEFDINNGRKSIAILSGSKENSIRVLSVIIAIAYFIVLAGVLLNEFNKTMLFVFLTLPIATKLISSMKDYIAIKNVEFKPRWYWGFFENWKSVQAKGLEFFMFRFYLARNLAFFFVIIAAIGVMK